MRSPMCIRTVTGHFHGRHFDMSRIWEAQVWLIKLMMTEFQLLALVSASVHAGSLSHCPDFLGHLSWFDIISDTCSACCDETGFLLWHRPISRLINPGVCVVPPYSPDRVWAVIPDSTLIWSMTSQHVILHFSLYLFQVPVHNSIISGALNMNKQHMQSRAQEK